MMKSKILVLAFFFSGCSFSSARAGLGGSFSYGASTTPQMLASLSVRTDVSPWCVFLNAHLEDNVFSVFADDWFVSERVAEHLDYFVLWGISGGFRFDDGVFALATGCRFGAGLDFFFFGRHLEIFAQAVWNPYFGVRKSGGSFSPVLRPVNFPCGAGIRVWF